MILLWIFGKMSKALINNSNTNGETCGNLENNRERQISNILETEPTHATGYNFKKGLHIKI